MNIYIIIINPTSPHKQSGTLLRYLTWYSKHAKPVCKNLPCYISALFTQKKNYVALRLIYFHLHLDLQRGIFSCHFKQKIVCNLYALYLNQVICVGWHGRRESDIFHLHSGRLATNSELPCAFCLWRTHMYLTQPAVLFKTRNIKLSYT
jgi:hypothetical protein